MNVLCTGYIKMQWTVKVELKRSSIKMSEQGFDFVGKPDNEILIISDDEDNSNQQRKPTNGAAVKEKFTSQKQLVNRTSVKNEPVHDTQVVNTNPVKQEFRNEKQLPNGAAVDIMSKNQQTHTAPRHKRQRINHGQSALEAAMGEDAEGLAVGDEAAQQNKDTKKTMSEWLPMLKTSLPTLRNPSCKLACISRDMLLWAIETTATEQPSALVTLDGATRQVQGLFSKVTSKAEEDMVSGRKLLKRFRTAEQQRNKDREAARNAEEGQ